MNPVTPIDSSDPLQLVLQFGALGALLYLLPLLKGINDRLGQLVDVAGGFVHGVRDAGIPLEPNAGIRQAVAGAIRKLAPVLLVALLVGCVSSSLAESARKLERSVDVFRRSSSPAPGVDPDRHAALGSAVTTHAAELRALSEEAR